MDSLKLKKIEEEIETKKKELVCEMIKPRIGVVLNRKDMNTLWCAITDVFGRKHPKPDENKNAFVNVTEWFDYLEIEYLEEQNYHFGDKVTITKIKENENINRQSDSEKVDALDRKLDFSKMTSSELEVLIRDSKEEVKCLERRINELIPNIRMLEVKLQMALNREKRERKEKEIASLISRLKEQLEKDGVDIVNSNGVYEITDGEKYFVGYIKKVNLLLSNIETQLKRNGCVMNVDKLSIQMLIDYKKLPWNEERARKMKGEIMNEYREQSKELVQFFSAKSLR